MIQEFSKDEFTLNTRTKLAKFHPNIVIQQHYVEISIIKAYA